jgi:anaerobic selenocysteine-containing dehydrogenase
VAQEDRDKSEVSVSRRAFLKGSAIATGALSSVLIPGATEAQLPDAVEPDPRHSVVSLKVNGVAYRKEVPNRTTCCSSCARI